MEKNEICFFKELLIFLHNEEIPSLNRYILSKKSKIDQTIKNFGYTDGYIVQTSLFIIALEYFFVTTSKKESFKEKIKLIEFDIIETKMDVNRIIAWYENYLKSIKNSSVVKSIEIIHNIDCINTTPDVTKINHITLFGYNSIENFDDKLEFINNLKDNLQIGNRNIGIIMFNIENLQQFLHINKDNVEAGYGIFYLSYNNPILYEILHYDIDKDINDKIINYQFSSVKIPSQFDNRYIYDVMTMKSNLFKPFFVDKIKTEMRTNFLNEMLSHQIKSMSDMVKIIVKVNDKIV